MKKRISFFDTEIGVQDKKIYDIGAERNGRDVHVAKFSKAFAENLQKWENKGYKAQQAKAQFIVAWKGENDEEETPVLLATIELTSTPKEP